MNTCYIVGAGESAPLDVHPDTTDLLIAADAGYRAVQDAGLRPDLVVGDFDSMGYVPENVPILQCPVEKDDTDTMIAIRHGLSGGYKEFQIYGGLGGRLDHSVANFHVLAYLAQRGAHGQLIGANEIVELIPAGGAATYYAGHGTVSIFAWGGEATGVTVTGCRYPLTDGMLTPNFPLGVSNEFTQVPATISVRSGQLLVIRNI